MIEAYNLAGIDIFVETIVLHCEESSAYPMDGLTRLRRSRFFNASTAAA